MRVWSRLTWVVILGAMGIGFVWIVWIKHSPGFDWQGPLAVGAFAWLGLVGARKGLESIGCPRCSRPFAGPARKTRKFGVRDPWVMAVRVPARPVGCHHCGLPYGAERDPDGGE